MKILSMKQFVPGRINLVLYISLEDFNYMVDSMEEPYIDKHNALLVYQQSGNYAWVKTNKL